MLYMMSCLVVMVAASYHLTTTLFSQLAYVSDENNPKPTYAMAILAMAMTLCFSAPVISTLMLILKADIGGGESIESVRRNVYLVLAGTVLVIAYAVLAFRRAPETERSSFWAVGRSVILAGVAVVGGVSAVAHLTFFSSSKDGMANIEFMREVAPLKDMDNCKSGVAFVQYREDEGPLTYRCPTLLMFGGLTSQPFAPWPDYVSGESQELATVIAGIKRDATKPDDQK